MRKFWRVLFSRYAISAVIIVAEVLLLCLFFLRAARYSFLLLSLAVLINLFVFFHLLGRDAMPEYKITWLIIVMLVPILGVVLYLLFYSRKLSRRETRHLHTVVQQIRRFELTYGDTRSDEVLAQLAQRDHAAAGKAYAILADDPLAQLYRATGSTYFSSGEDYFRSLLVDMERAERYIFLEYFILSDGGLWHDIHRILAAKARSGVEVRLLYDDVGSMRTLPDHLMERLTREHIFVRCFSPVTPRASSVHNNRDHRKIAVIDGEIAYTGGVNIADEYVNRICRFGHWKDGGIRVVGDAAEGLLAGFLSVWDLTTGGISDYGQYFRQGRLGLPVLPATQQTAAATGQTTAGGELSDDGFYLPFGSGPAPIYQRPVARNAMLNLIGSAQYYLYLMTPYLIVDYEMTQALCHAARRGVEVRIYTPGVPDKRAVKVMTKSAYRSLIAAGVHILEYAPGFLHAKAMVVDDAYAVVGTVNFDYRSFSHHFENGIWMYRTPTVQAVKQDFIRTAAVSREIDLHGARLRPHEWIVCSLMRLFAPLL